MNFKKNQSSRFNPTVAFFLTRRMIHDVDAVDAVGE